jgi:hypothetical protein
MLIHRPSYREALIGYRPPPSTITVASDGGVIDDDLGSDPKENVTTPVVDQHSHQRDHRRDREIARRRTGTPPRTRTSSTLKVVPHPHRVLVVGLEFLTQFSTDRDVPPPFLLLYIGSVDSRPFLNIVLRFLSDPQHRPAQIWTYDVGRWRRLATAHCSTSKWPCNAAWAQV